MKRTAYLIARMSTLTLGVLGLASCGSSNGNGEAVGRSESALHATNNAPNSYTGTTIKNVIGGPSGTYMLLITGGRGYELVYGSTADRDELISSVGLVPFDVVSDPALPGDDSTLLGTLFPGGTISAITPDMFQPLYAHNPSQASAFNAIDVATGAGGAIERRYFLTLLTPGTNPPVIERDETGTNILHNVGCGELLRALGFEVPTAVVLQNLPQPPNGNPSDKYDISCVKGQKPSDFVPRLTAAPGTEQTIGLGSPILPITLTPVNMSADTTVASTAGDCTDPSTGKSFLALSGFAITGGVPASFAKKQCTQTYVASSASAGNQSPPLVITIHVFQPASGHGPDEILLAGVRGWGSMPVASSSFTPTNPTKTFSVVNAAVSATFGAGAAKYGMDKLAGDFDGDGRTDVALAGAVGAVSMPIAFATASGVWNVVDDANSAVNGFATQAALAGARRLVGDFNGDGKSDIVLTGSTSFGGLPVAFSVGDGNWTIPPLDPHADFATSSSTARLRFTGDFNNDGKTDIALAPQASWGGATMPVAFSKGDGTWRVTTGTVGAAFVALVDSPGAELLTGDFNHDGRTDVALTGPSNWPTIPMALANDDGSWTVQNTDFTAAIDANTKTFAGLSSVRGVKRVVGDFNHDGKSDIALTGPIGWTQIPVAFSNGDGTWHVTFGGASQFAGEASAAGVTLVVGDFNRDGRSDIAATGNASWDHIPVALSIGDGTFDGASVDWQLTDSNFAVLSNEANVANAAKLVGYASGAPQTGVADPEPPPSRRAPEADEILLVGAPAGTTIPVAAANGDGTWTLTYGSVGAAERVTTWSKCGRRMCAHETGTDFGWLAAAAGGESGASMGGGWTRLVGDYDGDGRTDVALAGTTVPVAFATGGGNWRVTKDSADGFTASALRNPPGNTLVGDFDGDGKSDVMTAGGGFSDAVAPTLAPIAFSNGDGTWRTPTAVTLPAQFSAAAQFQEGALGAPWTGDFDGDGRVDVATGMPPTIAFSNGDGRWTTSISPAALVGDCQYLATWAAVANAVVLHGDFNGDGKTDFALTGPYTWGSVPVAFATGDGNWVCTNDPVPGNFAYQAGVSGRIVGDFDGDGRADIALTGRADTAIIFANGDGTWRFADPSVSVAPAGTQAFAGDFNRDGRTDIAWTLPLSAATGGASLMVSFSTAAGGLTAPAPSGALGDPWGHGGFEYAGRVQ